MKPYTTRIMTGLGIIILGAALLLASLNIFNFNELIQDWWPLFIIGAGIILFINDIKNYVWALLIVLIGTLFQLQELDIVDVNPWQLFWPLIIIAVGISVIFNRPVAAHRINKSERDDATAILGANDQKNVSDDYKGGKITAVLGGVKVDLRKATIKEQATVEVFSFWGGVELIVPRNVVVRKRVNAILGGVEDKTDQETTKSSPVLYVAGDVIMAGVEIKN